MEEPSSPCLHGVLLLQRDQSGGVHGGREGSSEADRTLHLQVQCRQLLMCVIMCCGGNVLAGVAFDSGLKKGRPRSLTHLAPFLLLQREIQTGDIWTKQNWCLVSNREYRPRENVTFLENGTKVFALNPKSFVFVREKSAGDPEVDIMTTINIPYVVSCVYYSTTTSLRFGAATFWFGCTFQVYNWHAAVCVRRYSIPICVILPNVTGPSLWREDARLLC